MVAGSSLGDGHCCLAQTRGGKIFSSGVNRFVYASTPAWKPETRFACIALPAALMKRGHSSCARYCCRPLKKTKKNKQGYMVRTHDVTTLLLLYKNVIPWLANTTRTPKLVHSPPTFTRKTQHKVRMAASYGGSCGTHRPVLNFLCSAGSTQWWRCVSAPPRQPCLWPDRIRHGRGKESQASAGQTATGEERKSGGGVAVWTIAAVRDSSCSIFLSLSLDNAGGRQQYRLRNLHVSHLSGNPSLPAS